MSISQTIEKNHNKIQSYLIALDYTYQNEGIPIPISTDITPIQDMWESAVDKFMQDVESYANKYQDFYEQSKQIQLEL